MQTIVFTINSESLSACDVPPNEGCDSEFFYCVRPLGTNVTPPGPTTATAPGVFIGERTIAMLQCLQPPGAVRSDVNNISASVDFTSATLLGQPNPLEFKVIATKWEVSDYATSHWECIIVESKKLQRTVSCQEFTVRAKSPATTCIIRPALLYVVSSH